MTGRHEGENTGRPDYAYTGRHEAPPAPGCEARATVADTNGESGGLLVCNRPAHDDPQHLDESDGILWEAVHIAVPVLAVPAGAVA